MNMNGACWMRRSLGEPVSALYIDSQNNVIAGGWNGRLIKWRASGDDLWSVQLPVLRPLILLTMAIGFSVSLAQYLPTTLAGAGRWSTLTPEAVSLASGQDRRLLSLLGIWQSFLPALALSLAWLLRGPAWQKNF